MRVTLSVQVDGDHFTADLTRDADHIVGADGEVAATVGDAATIVIDHAVTQVKAAMAAGEATP